MHIGRGDRLRIWPLLQLSDSVTLTLALDRVIRHTVVYHSLTSTCTCTCVPYFVQIGKTFCGQTDGRMDIEIGFIGSLGGADLNIKFLWTDHE